MISTQFPSIKLSNASSFLALNPSVVGLSLFYIVAMSGRFQYSIRLGAEVESTVSQCG